MALGEHCIGARHPEQQARLVVDIGEPYVAGDLVGAYCRHRRPAAWSDPGSLRPHVGRHLWVAFRDAQHFEVGSFADALDLVRAQATTENERAAGGALCAAGHDGLRGQQDRPGGRQEYAGQPVRGQHAVVERGVLQQSVQQVGIYRKELVSVPVARPARGDLVLAIQDHQEIEIEARERLAAKVGVEKSRVMAEEERKRYRPRLPNWMPARAERGYSPLKYSRTWSTWRSTSAVSILTALLTRITLDTRRRMVSKPIMVTTHKQCSAAKGHGSGRFLVPARQRASGWPWQVMVSSLAKTCARTLSGSGP